ncbi:hypothetical protein FSP39_024007 [Pinctada imbricata]|uniref:Protein stoned-B n=1 Tax=Pinctada imbricata TaxID=66713 RepID=A0AA88XXY8_PINIB|nr:hypothetical protein FSP39_024007 [Pinctada imbricata]
MSANSFDESSNLVIEVTSPSDKNDGHFDDPGNSTDSDLKDKSSKAGFFKKKRSKSPFRSPLKSPIKSPLKSPFKSSKPSKSSKSLKSPTEELLPDDVKDIEEKIKEKDSDEWKAFQQMQERIKQNVLKSQSSLSKLTNENCEGSSEKKGEASIKTKRRAPDIPKWSTSSYDDESSLIKDKNDSNGIVEDSAFDEKVISDDIESLDLNLTSFISPGRTPNPPANSLRTSMENLDEASGTNTGEQSAPEADLLGLSLDNDSSNVACSSEVGQDEYINQDLLGLDNFISMDSQQGSLHSSFDVPDMMMYGSSVHSSARTTPLGFDDPELFPGINEPSTLTSSFVSEMVNEFLQLDTMKEASPNLSLNPFDSTAAKVRDDLDSLDPFAPSKAGIQSEDLFQQPKSLENSGLSSSLQPQPISSEFDPFTAIDDSNEDTETGIDLPVGSNGATMFDPFDGGKHNTIGRATLDHVYDNFGFGLADAKQNETNAPDASSDEHSILFDNNKNELHEPINPFLSETSVKEQSNAKGSEISDKLFDDPFSGVVKQGLGDSGIQGDIWGTDNIDSSKLDSNVANPFQDDIFSFEAVSTSDTSAASTDRTAKLNPFLSDDLSSSSLPVNKNPFLDVEGSNEARPSNVSTDLGLFLMQSSHDKQNDEKVKSPTLEDLDPFKPSVAKTAETRVVGDTENDTLDPFKGTKLLNFDDDVDDDDEDTTFKLKIKPVMSDTNTITNLADLPPPPAIKPPPAPMRSPQPPRENPFNRDSPPEENFAKFEIMHEKEEEEETEENENEKKAPPQISMEKSSSISTTETTTPEEELNLEPLESFYPASDKQIWKLMLRQPTKKKLTTNRYWKNISVKVLRQSDGPVIKLYRDDECKDSVQELPLQPCYSVSDISLQHYDQYGKIHTVKMQYIFYRERVGLKAERLTPSFVRKPKATMILDHAPQVSELMKFGCLDKLEMQSFVREIEDSLMNLEVHREKTLTYVKEEVCAEVWDEYMAELDSTGKMLTQKARCRVFFLAFVTGMPTCEIGLNDRRRRGKEVVGRHDIIPIKTEEWIRIEDPVFHCCIDKNEFEKSNNIRFHPLDACQVELVRYRVRLRENKELPLQLKIQQILRDSRCEIRCDLLVTGYHSFSKKHGQFPCENIEIHFPIPESWIYLFRYEKRFGYGSFKSAMRKPGKIKGLERITMMAQGLLSPTLMEADVGVAKYENLYKAVVWRIPRLPERNEGAYKAHLFRMTLDFSAHDDIPESFELYSSVDFTMPSCTVSQSQVRSISVENPNPPEKWVRYLAKYHYRIEIDHIDERTKKKEEVEVKTESPAEENSDDSD